MVKDFKNFIMRGNVIDLAIGIIIGTAFGKIVTSLVNDIIMPPVGLLLGKINFSSLYVNISGKAYDSLAAAQADGAATINYGLFINTLIDFLIVALVIFLVLRPVNNLLYPAKPADPKPETKNCPYCLSEIPAKATRCPHCTSQLE